MHVSLYRKFRPDTFDKMVRQEHVVTILKNQIISGAIGHAYLFSGPRGTGKTSVARIFARAINCEHPQDGSPCGKCPTCRALAAGGLDVLEIDAASNNGVDEMRDLREKVLYPPTEGKYKVYIVDEVHMLTGSAFNALLKTLEDPPAHAVFILATTEPHKIPATILSRCMRMDFKLIPQEDLKAHLMRILDEIGKPYEREAVSAIARAGAGSDRDMLSIAEMCLSYGDKLTYRGVTEVLGAADSRDTLALCDALLGAQMPVALEGVERILAAGKAVGVIMRDLLVTLNQIAIVKLCAGAEKLLSLPQEQFAALKEVASRADGRAILRATEILARAESELRFVSSPRVALETAIMRISLPEYEESVDALMVRVKALEEALARTPMPLAAPAEVAQAAVQPPREAPSAQKKSDPAEEDGYIPPMEEPIFSEAYFSDMPQEPVPAAQERGKAEPVVKRESVAKQEPAPAAPPAKTETAAAPAAGGEPAEVVYGRFIRTLRRTSKNGVLFTMCSDLEAVYEGDMLVLYTASPTVLRSLSREDHREMMKEVFTGLGVAQFEVRLKGERSKQDKSGLEELKKNFEGYPIEIK